MVSKQKGGASDSLSEILKKTKRINYDPETQRKKRIKELSKNAKSLYELVVSEDFVVSEVVSESYATSIRTEPVRVGGHNFSEEGGYTSKLILKVKSKNKKVPVETLKFLGFSAVKAGDYISVKIPRYKEASTFVMPQNSLDEGKRTFYYDRKFQKEESAIELNILSSIISKEILRTDRAVDYERFVKR